jgi:hypothetical protein
LSVTGKKEGRVFQRNKRSAVICPGTGHPVFDTFKAFDLTGFPNDGPGGDEIAYLYALGFSLPNFVLKCRHLLSCTPVQDHWHSFSAQNRAGDIQSRIAAAYNQNRLTGFKRDLFFAALKKRNAIHNARVRVPVKTQFYGFLSTDTQEYPLVFGPEFIPGKVMAYF